MRKLCLILIAACPFFCQAQYIGDTITMYIDNQVELVIAAPDYALLKKSENANKIIQTFESYLPEISKQLKSDRADLVKYSINESITIEEALQKDVFLLTDGEIKYTGIRDKAILKSKEYHITITTNDLSKIGNISMLSCLQKVIEKLPKNRNLSKSLYFQCIGDEVTILVDKGVTNSQIDAIELTFGAGANLIKNQWVGDFRFQLGILLNEKGAIKHNPHISFNLLYDFVGNRKMNINTFMNIGYSWNKDKEKKEGSMFGMELGYLISRQGEMFDKDTYRLGLIWSPTTAVTVSPQIYISDGFKRFYPGIRVGFGI